MDEKNNPVVAYGVILLALVALFWYFGVYNSPANLVGQSASFKEPTKVDLGCQSTVLGDVSGDSLVTATDASMLDLYLKGQLDKPYCLDQNSNGVNGNGDVDKDGSLDRSDVVMIGSISR